MKIRAITQCLLISLFIIVSMSANASDKPAACPTAEALKKEGFSSIKKHTNYDIYIATNISAYTTPNVWGFIMGVPGDQAVNEADAMNKAKAALTSINVNPLPRYESGQWVCIYRNSYDYLAAAITPLHLNSEIVSTIKQLKK